MNFSMFLRFAYISVVLFCFSYLNTVACASVTSVPNAVSVPQGGSRLLTAADSDELMKAIKQYNGEPAILQRIKQSIKNIEQKDPECPYIDIGNGMLALYSGRKNYSEYKKEDVEKAVDFFNKALQKDPKLFDAYIYGAYSSLYMNNFRAAEFKAKIAENIKPSSPLLILLNAEMSLKDKDFDEAKKLSQKVIDMETDSDAIVRAQLILLRIYISAKRYDDADSSCDKLTTLRPKSPWILMECSNYFKSQNEFNKALECAEKAIAGNDKLSPETRSYLSNLYVEQGYDMQRHQAKGWEERSLDVFKKAISYNPQNPFPYYRLAWINFYLGRETKDENYLHEAIRYLDKLRELNSSFPHADKLLETIRQEQNNIRRNKR